MTIVVNRRYIKLNELQKCSKDDKSQTKLCFHTDPEHVSVFHPHPHPPGEKSEKNEIKAKVKTYLKSVKLWNVITFLQYILICTIDDGYLKFYIFLK